MGESPSARWKLITALGLVLLTLLAARFDLGDWVSLWPSLLALALVFLTGRVLLGLLIGAFAGQFILKEGHLIEAALGFFPEHLFPSFGSSWKLSALIFTLLLGGFAALVEKGGGLRTLLDRLVAGVSGIKAARRFQTASMGLGLVCFFDGLANSMLIGRVTRSMADVVRVSRVRMAYLVDSTSSAVACVAFISTWIAFQLSLINQGLEVHANSSSAVPSPYNLFFRSIPVNFYCLFTLILLAVSIQKDLLIGPMRRFELEARASRKAEVTQTVGSSGGPVWSAVIPLLLLVLGIMGAFCVFYEFEARPANWNLITLAQAFSTGYGAEAMILGSMVGIFAAWLAFPKPSDPEPAPSRLSVFLGGIRSLIGPVFILISAWMLGSVVRGLGTADFVSGLLVGNLPYGLLPALVFLTGAIISFSTGTSWGTMGILMPLALPSVFLMGEDLGVSSETITSSLVLVIAAVFSGAVFGDHCSPFSDTTIVSSIACGVDPKDHVKTQLPYAMLAAGAALLLGFLPAGFGFSGWLSLLLGLLFFLALPFVIRLRVDKEIESAG